MGWFRRNATHGRYDRFAKQVVADLGVKIYQGSRSLDMMQLGIGCCATFLSGLGEGIAAQGLFDEKGLLTKERIVALAEPLAATWVLSFVKEHVLSNDLPPFLENQNPGELGKDLLQLLSVATEDLIDKLHFYGYLPAA